MKKSIKEFVAMAISATMLFTTATTFVSATETNKTDLDKETAIVYNGAPIQPDVQMFSSGTKLVNGTDYDLTYENNTNVGEATINVTFKGNYTGTRIVTFNIVAQDLTNESVSFTAIENQTYTGEALTPAITIKVGETTLVSGTDFDVTYENNVDVGTATVNVTFKGNYSGSASTTFEIGALTIDPTKVSFTTIEEQPYTGSVITPEPTISYDGKTLEKGKDYELTYSDNVNVGTGTVNVTFKGNYSGTADTSFQITAKVVTEQNVTIDPIADQKYTGKEIKPEPVITDIGV